MRNDFNQLKSDLDVVNDKLDQLHNSLHEVKVKSKETKSKIRNAVELKEGIIYKIILSELREERSSLNKTIKLYNKEKQDIEIQLANIPEKGINR